MAIKISDYHHKWPPIWNRGPLAFSLEYIQENSGRTVYSIISSTVRFFTFDETALRMVRMA